MDLLDDIRDLGGLAPTYALLRRGWDGRQLARAVHSGAVVRVRQGWYASPLEPESHLRAWRVGGRLSCVTGALEHGLWVPQRPEIHVAVKATDGRLRSPEDKTRRLAPIHPDVVVHWGDSRSGTRFVSGPLTCLRHMTTCVAPEFVMAAADSALRSGLITRSGWRRMIADMPAALRIRLGDISRGSGSITESIVRFRLRLLGIPVRIQVPVARGVRVDILVAGRIVVELEGYEFHGSRAQFEADRRREARITRLGYRYLRFSYHQVIEEWPAVLASIQAALAA